MGLHSSEAEFEARKKKTLSLMQDRYLDGLLMFRQERMYYLSGCDSFGYVFFQCIHIILMDTEAVQAVCFGHTVVVTESGCEALSRMLLELVVKSEMMARLTREQIEKEPATLWGIIALIYNRRGGGHEKT
jgi:hypothetical protein